VVAPRVRVCVRMGTGRKHRRGGVEKKRSLDAERREADRCEEPGKGRGFPVD
jgi:hypothetical protein